MSKVTLSENLIFWTDNLYPNGNQIGKHVGTVTVTFLTEEYFELKIVFPDGSYRKLYISQNALLPKSREAK